MEDFKNQLLKRLSDCVAEMEDENVINVANEYVENNFDAYEGITVGLSDGMERAGQLYEDEEYFIPELLMCSEAMYNGLDILKPKLKRVDEQNKNKVVIGVVEGDTHDIGKNLVKIMLETVGFEVYDLGKDVPVDDFIKKTKEVKADIICMSTLMTTTMLNMKRVIERLSEENIRDNVKVMVGGGPISPTFAKLIGADAYTDSAAQAAKVAKQLVG